MRLLVAASRSFNHLNRRHISFRGAHLNHWSVCCWIPLFGLLATHPFAVWSFPLDNQRTRAFTFFPNPAVIMPPSRSSSTKIEATKETEDEASPRRSPRKRTRKGEEDQEEPKPTAKKATAKKTKGATTKKRTIAASDDESVTKKKRTKGTTTKKRASAKASDDESVASTGSKGKAKKKKSPAKKKASDHQRITERDEIKKLWDAEKALADGSYSKRLSYFTSLPMILVADLTLSFFSLQHSKLHLGMSLDSELL